MATAVARVSASRALKAPAAKQQQRRLHSRQSVTAPVRPVASAAHVAAPVADAPKPLGRGTSHVAKAGMLESIKEKAPWAETTFYIGVWYLLNVKFNIINKTIYNYFPFPWFVSCVHLFIGLFVMGALWGTKAVPYEQPDKQFLKDMTLPAFLHAFGHCLTNVSFATVAVSFTHIVKTLEPVCSAIGAYFLMGTAYSPLVYASLLPIMLGVALAAATELSFNWLGFGCAMASNVSFAGRAIFSKKLMSGMSPMNLYNWITIVSLAMCIPPMLYFEGSTLAAGFAAASKKVGTETLLWSLFNVGFFYHTYNTVAYMALGKVEPVTHAVANVGKRIFVIGFSIIAFGNTITQQTAIGSAIAIFGGFLYSYLKATTPAKA